MLAMKQQTAIDGRTIADIERDLPSRKSSHTANITRYAQELSQGLDSMLNFYNDRFSSLGFLNYIGKQKAESELVNTMFNGGKEYTARKQEEKKKKDRKDSKRDVNASRNIHLIAATLANGREGPTIFTRTSST
ncbi:uncharacterized protein BYT42DRAFT_634948 [Radiomyces spectabilis]|uniref:uncharacterized protein n=1 Tax=Radiomyces spectabilis TaxID=64574 RepID=UPI00221EF96C|nr:uncharacterized protein BYT42DRAFT_634948 [Radiomyces spectabilis]KAI8381610.1 hypothetical protein BYT42DRAFT_634948 [Radiomyces spectabilis]